jgi:cell division protein FtsI/penicillin-binding protein 2
MKNDKTLAQRLYFLIAVMLIWTAVIGARLYFLHVVQSADLKGRAQRQQQRVLDISPRRGIIYDRNGNELAISVKVDSVFGVPDEIENRAATAKKLAALTGMSRASLLKKFESDRSFVWIKRKLGQKEAEAIRRAGLPGIYFQKEDRRFYPKGQMASHVLGYVNMDEEGMGGLEYRYNASVRGSAGRVVFMTDARGRRFNSMEQAPVPGANLITTVDENIQYIVEKELHAAVARTRPKGISIIAADPRSGEILGMANYPTFNPNQYGKYSPQSWVNRALSHVYEPGSTFKIATAAAALEERLTTPDEMIDCQLGSIVLHGHRIRDAHPYGLLSVKEIIQNSSNVGIIKLGLRIGDGRLAGYVDRLGFGRPSRIDLPGEERGLTKPASRWSKISIGAISMGQEIGVTPLQILSMISAVANGGILYRPYVVQRVEHPQEGVIADTEPQGERVISEKTARQLQDMLEVVVTDGTARASQLDGYRAAGKTGTAQKIDESGRYAPNKYVASFVGYAPASNPSLALIVVVDEPTGAYYGAQVAAPVFKSIAEQILRYQSVVPDVPAYSPQYTDSVPFPSGGGPRDSAGEGTPECAACLPPPGPVLVPVSFSAAGTTGRSQPGALIMPDFAGKSLRQVAEESLRLGLRLRSFGSGGAIRQSPAPGSSVRSGARIQVEFSTRQALRRAADEK